MLLKQLTYLYKLRKNTTDNNTHRLYGLILLNVQTRKSILSAGGGYDVFRFVDMDTKLIEFEDGNGFNESVTYATRAAVEEAVLELIYQGHDRGYWVIGETNEDE